VAAATAPRAPFAAARADVAFLVAALVTGAVLVVVVVLAASAAADAAGSCRHAAGGARLWPAVDAQAAAFSPARVPVQRIVVQVAVQDAAVVV
jgi:hypothetical protein